MERRYGCRGIGPLVLTCVSMRCLWVYSRNIHLLKLVTGVDISTRPVNRSGSPGNEVKRRSRTAAAAPKSATFLLSISIL
jgi:hypothetical protein